MSTDSSSSSSSSSPLTDDFLQSSSNFSISSSGSSDSYENDSNGGDSDDTTSRFYFRSLNEWSDVGSDIEYTPNDILRSEVDDYEAFFWHQIEPQRRRSAPEPLLVSWQVKKTPSPGLHFLGGQKLKLVPRGDTPFDYFNLLADEEFLNTIIMATNRNADRILSEVQHSTGRTFVWNDLEIPEFKTFLGLLYLSGPDLEANWRPSKHFLNPVFPKSMSRDRFLSIMKALSFTEREATRSPQFKTEEIRYFIELIAYQMSKVYSPGRELCIGSVSVFRSWSEKGLRMCTLIDPVGVVLDVHVCFDCQDCESEKHSDEMVLKILRPYFNLGHSVFVCKKYGSVRLARLLASNKFNYTGRVSPKRDSDITEWLKNRLDNEDCEALYTEGGLSCIKLREKWDEFWLSTEFGHKPTVDTSHPVSVDRAHPKPESVVRYYETMAACGRLENFIAHDIEGTYYMKMVVKLFSLLLFNTISLYNKFSDYHRIEPSRFKEEIIKNLLDPGMSGVRNRIVTQSHFPVEVNRQAQCKYCYTNGWTQSINFICPNCPSQPFLCLKCFRPYHTTYFNI
ncbi:uncharacterized protein LOC106672395 [Cimex lectularius]|uniref:PiggyBac transposable element-derived protein domain-containing protein n=1 Tax=Cimex lectularius TaxID=79782 RepID=A0A8I6TK81_CIMLE|nr:uncharacterized protein LOC106672395 [Cimex lectularius]